jgi:hypothetical protein
MAVLDVPLFFISQSAVDSRLCDVASIQRDFRDPLDHTIKIRHNFWHVVPSRARFTAYVLLTIVTVLPLDTCSRSRVFTIKINGADGGHESRGPCLYIPRPLTPSRFTLHSPPCILSPQRHHESSAISDEPPPGVLRRRSFFRRSSSSKHRAHFIAGVNLYSSPP